MLASKELGGAGIVALHIASGLRERAQESHVWIPGEGAARNKSIEMKLDHHSYDSVSALKSCKIRRVIHNWGIGRKLRLHSPGLIHVHSLFCYKVLHSAIKMSQLRSVVHIQLEEEKEGLRWALTEPPDLIITCAEYLVEYVRSTLPERHQEHQPIVAVPNSVDVERFRPGEKLVARRQVGARTEIPLVIMVANLAPHKGQETVIRAASVLKELGVNALFWLAGIERGGKQEYTTRLRSLCMALGVADRVHFLGHREDVPNLLRAADIFSSLLPRKVFRCPYWRLRQRRFQCSRLPPLAYQGCD
jgi:glycosyltransferase involved in cell wall biosynthesis